MAGQREPAGSGWSHRQNQSRLLHGLEQKHCFGTKKKLTGLSTPESTDRCYVDKIHRNYLQPGGKKDSNIITREARRSQGKILEVWPLVHKASCEARPCSQGQLAGWPAAVRGPAWAAPSPASATPGMGLPPHTRGQPRPREVTCLGQRHTASQPGSRGQSSCAHHSVRTSAPPEPEIAWHFSTGFKGACFSIPVYR